MSGIVIIPSGSESYLQAAVASAGPIATAVDARANGFRVSHTIAIQPEPARDHYVGWSIAF